MTLLCAFFDRHGCPGHSARFAFGERRRICAYSVELDPLVGEWASGGERALIAEWVGDQIFIRNPIIDASRFELSNASAARATITFTQKRFLLDGSKHPFNGVPCDATISPLAHDRDSLTFAMTSEHMPEGESDVNLADSVFGRIASQETAAIWLDVNFSGSLATGYQSTKLSVSGDFEGAISSRAEDPSLLYLCVGGFAANESFSSICSIGFALFNASVGASDVEPGPYPHRPGRQTTPKGTSFFRWCVQTRRATTEP